MKCDNHIGIKHYFIKPVTDYRKQAISVGPSECGEKCSRIVCAITFRR